MIIFNCISEIDAIGKPRMTRRDSWSERPCVLKYRNYSDILKADIIDAIKNNNEWWNFKYTKKNIPKIAIKTGWCVKLDWIAYYKHKSNKIIPHTKKPDRDNIDKFILDVFDNDQSVFSGEIAKFYWPNESKLFVFGKVEQIKYFDSETLINGVD